MPLRLALGYPLPYLLPGEFPTPEDALTTAKNYFETLQDEVAVSIWNTTRKLGIANGDFIDAITPESWQGLRTADRLQFYPTGANLNEPLHIVEPARFSQVEYRNFLDGITEPQDDRNFGPLLVDGEYFLKTCGTSVQVIYTPTGGHFASDNFLANGPPNGGNSPPFRWIYKALPFGLLDAVVPFSSPDSAQHTFADLIPGVLYTYEVTDEAEDLEEDA